MSKYYQKKDTMPVAIKGIEYECPGAELVKLMPLAKQNVEDEWMENNEDPNAVFLVSDYADAIEEEARELYRCDKGLPKTIVVEAAMDKKEAESLSPAQVVKLVAPELPEDVKIHSFAASGQATPKDKMDYRVFKAFTDMLDRKEFAKVLSLSKLNYSFHNMMSVYAKKPNATIVRGFQTWKNEFNRVPNAGSGIPIVAISVPSLKATAITCDQDIVDFAKKHYSWLQTKAFTKKMDSLRKDAAAGKDLYGPTWYKEMTVFDVSDTTVIPGKEDVIDKVLNFDKKAVRGLDDTERAILQKVNAGENIPPAADAYLALNAYAEEFFAYRTKEIVGIGNPYPEEGLGHTVEKLLFIGLCSEQMNYGLSDTVSKELQRTFNSARYTDKQFLFEYMMRRATALNKQWSLAYKAAEKEISKTAAHKKSEKTML